MRLVYLSPVPWASFAQRPHKFVDWFHARTGGEVLWVDPYPTRFPVPGDLQRFGFRDDRQNYQSPPWMTIVRLRSLPIEPLPASGWVNGFLWKSTLHDIERFAYAAPSLVAVGKPSVFALRVLKHLEDTPSLYDAMDNFPAFYSGLPRLAMASRERSLAQRVTHVFTSSTTLRKRLATVREDIQMVPNGLDAAILPPPKLVASQRSSKVFGYVGTVGRWFDWDWIGALAKMRPNDTVRLIGPVFTPPPRALPRNVELLSPREHASALQAMLNFDVGLIPFKKNDLTASVDPIKYYEYRALGLPMVSTGFGEMALRRAEEGTFLSDGLHDIEELMDMALRYVPAAAEIREFTSNNSWEARFAATRLLS